MQEERRKHPRVPQSDPVAVTILGAPSAPELVGEVVFCSTQNLSAGGLQIALGRELPVGTSLRISVGFRDPPGSFELVGRAAWVRALGPGGGFAVGIRLTYTHPTALAEWERLVAAMADATGH